VRYPTIKNFLIKVIIRVGRFLAFIDGPHHLGGAHQQMVIMISIGLSNFKIESSQVLTQLLDIHRWAPLHVFSEWGPSFSPLCQTTSENAIGTGQDF